MPISTVKKIHKTGREQRSRTVGLPAGWWKSLDPNEDSVAFLLDKAGIMAPVGMTEEEVAESIIFLLKQSQNKENIVKIFERIFNVDIVETNPGKKKKVKK